MMTEMQHCMPGTSHPTLLTCNATYGSHSCVYLCCLLCSVTCSSCIFLSSRFLRYSCREYCLQARWKPHDKIKQVCQHCT